jgi:hypothetical protein
LSEQDFGGGHRDLLHLQLTAAIRCASSDPTQQRLIRLRIAPNPTPSLVVELMGGFAEEKAFPGRGEIEPATAQLAGDAFVVFLGIVPQEAKLEPPLARRRAVTGPGIAAGFGQYRQDRGAETERVSGVSADRRNSHTSDKPTAKPETRAAEEARRTSKT